jgi:hypothetical protein
MKSPGGFTVLYPAMSDSTRHPLEVMGRATRASAMPTFALSDTNSEKNAHCVQRTLSV